MSFDIETNTPLLMPETDLYIPQGLIDYKPTSIYFYASEDGEHAKLFRPTESFLRHRQEVEDKLQEILDGQVTLTILNHV